VVLAQALVQGARLLLLDEPATTLDVSHQLRLFELLRQLNAEGLTVVCVLHDLNMALACFDRALVLSNGEVAAWGPADEALTPTVLEAVYGVQATLHRHAGRSYLTFVPRSWAERRAPRGRVHVVGGGGTASTLMRGLVDAGYEVSAGVLNALDSDEVTGRELALPMAVEAAFSEITDEAYAENRRLIARADVVVLADVPLGRGNARNVEAVRGAIADGKRVLAAQGVLDNDFDGVAATLRDRPPEFLPDVDAILRELSEG